MLVDMGKMDCISKILVVSLFSLLGLFINTLFAQEAGHVHKPHPHRHKQYAKVKNPVPETEQSMKKGAEFFSKHCVGCHGDGGQGDGTLNLTDDMVIHGDTDGEIFHAITDGAKGTQRIVPGEVGYLLTGPDGKDFRTMSMAMYGGYGADISLKLKGLYTVRTNIMIESGKEAKLYDEFILEVK